MEKKNIETSINVEESYLFQLAEISVLFGHSHG